ncbi:Poly [ADP-ribose] polymerase tankyrase-1 (ADP-ribosyltransferase diphtheria toxin-like 5) (ARTD5) (Poly [ADP-ribose] polymerase 5A) (Protein poly-ADP-ribosyltransferase tankyrase-1) (TNKS-1) (TRF1-interacting ankyrin-related ADP-ribose polymerase) (Tankyrase I) (Tankyrase-1) (TANK1), partial [Durusdinium trenchii]
MALGLFQASFEGNLDEVYRNIFEDADVHEPNQVGNRPLHAAAHQGHIAVVEVLLRAGADPNAVGRAGNTPLHYAVKGGHVHVIRALLEHRADPTTRNARHSSARDLALLPDHAKALSDEMVDLLDRWVLGKCSFLQGAPSVAPEMQRGQKLPSRCATPPAAPDDGKAVLEAVKPLIVESALQQHRSKDELAAAPSLSSSLSSSRQQGDQQTAQAGQPSDELQPHRRPSDLFPSQRKLAHQHSDRSLNLMERINQVSLEGKSTLPSP